MCGIAGYISFKKEVDISSIISSMLKAIEHRGPDGRGMYCKQSVGLGHVRLSIIDLSTSSDQPLYFDNENLVLVFNGEIYNYQDLKKSHF